MADIKFMKATVYEVEFWRTVQKVFGRKNRQKVITN
jgi:hypothetical protein